MIYTGNTSHRCYEAKEEVQKQNKAAENRPEDGVRELQTLQTQILQQPAAADDALQS